MFHPPFLGERRTTEVESCTTGEDVAKSILRRQVSQVEFSILNSTICRSLLVCGLSEHLISSALFSQLTLMKVQLAKLVICNLSFNHPWLVLFLWKKDRKKSMSEISWIQCVDAFSRCVSQRDWRCEGLDCWFGDRQLALYPGRQGLYSWSRFRTGIPTCLSFVSIIFATNCEARLQYSSRSAGDIVQVSSNHMLYIFQLQLQTQFSLCYSFLSFLSFLSLPFFYPLCICWPDIWRWDLFFVWGPTKVRPSVLPFVRSLYFYCFLVHSFARVHIFSHAHCCAVLFFSISYKT